MAPGIIEDVSHKLEHLTPARTKNTASTSRLQDALDAAISRFEERNPISKRLHDEATRSLPGGNTRTLLHTSPFPVCMKSGHGYQVTDEDGHTYTDLTGELSAGLYGHSHPVILDAIKTTLDTVGLNLGSTTAYEARYAALLCARFGLERVRFANSGTEANLHALGAARRFAGAGKRKVVVFGGGYHGAVLSFGAGVVAPNNVDGGEWVVARYNDVEAARAAIEGTDGVAAVLVEAMQGSGGCIPATEEFMLAVQESAKKANAVFILDEVMTSRLAPGGLKSTMNLSPDLTTFGKYLGGGLAFGAFGGRAEVMSVYDPRLAGSIAHSGTFNNNTLAMGAGHAGLAHVYTPAVSEAFTAAGDGLLRRLQRVSERTKCSWTGIGTLLSSHFCDELVRTKSLCGDDMRERDDLKDLFWLEMMEQGFWVTRRGMLAMVLGTPEEELDRFVSAVGTFLEKYADFVSTVG
ncbi:hypothetical protein MBLNU459_g7358t1 [Dothideomycetes sp. NU459]